MRWPPCWWPGRDGRDLASAAMPSWKQMTQREREAELVFRGEQVRARHRAVPAARRPRRQSAESRCARSTEISPQEVQGSDYRRRLRPDFAHHADGRSNLADARNRQTGGAPAGTTAPRPPAAGCRSRVRVWPRHPARCDQSAVGSTVAGGIVGVQSKSKAQSIRIYNGRTHYNEWQFVYIPQTGPGGRGQPGRPRTPGVRQPGPQRGGTQRGPFRGGGRFGPPTCPSPAGGRAHRAADAGRPARTRTFQVIRRALGQPAVHTAAAAS